MSNEITWSSVTESAMSMLDGRGLGGVYLDRLKFEISEVEKQGAEAVWVGYLKGKKRFKSNPNNLVLPWLLGMVEDDPISSRSKPMLNTVRASKVAEFKEGNGYIPHDLLKDSDSPDIDIDCLPAARDPIKEYAISQYGQNVGDEYGSVCSVGTWQTYKFKQALTDAAIALGYISGHKGKADKGKSGATQNYDNLPNRYFFEKEYTGQLPENVDELKDGGRATCKRKPPGSEKECGVQYSGIVCPSCNEETETDGPTIGQLIREHEVLRRMRQNFPPTAVVDKETGLEVMRPDLIDTAVDLIGRVRNMGMHAGAIIITDRPLYGNVPLAKSGKKGYWVSMWTEGRNTQLSKFGYIKWDLLGLKTLEYIFRCCQLIEENRGISFGENMSGWDDIDPLQRRAGHFFDGNGVKHYIDLDDKYALKLANEQKTDGIFQFDTDLAKSILVNQSHCFEDLMLFNAMGHPGPMASIPEAVANRGDKHASWQKKLHPTILDVLKDTYGVIVYQEQLQAIWQRVAGFTAPEAQEARKAVAKKWKHKLKPIEAKWIAGATPVLGKNEAMDWWPRMETFGRYAFNKSHAVSYCLVAHRCLWLKAHFAPEFWAAVMSDCHPDKLVRYMGVARAEEWVPTDITYCGKFKGKGNVRGVQFGTLNASNLTVDFTVTGDTVNQGLIGVKGVGEKAALVFQGKHDINDIDGFVQSGGKQSKTVMERLIKLGGFSHVPGHENARALWHWYMFKYCKSGKSMTQLRREIKQKLTLLEGWDDKKIATFISQQIAEYKRQFPKRNKVPPKYSNWKPDIKITREKVMALYPDDFKMEERLQFQKDYLGYWIDSPLDVYKCHGRYTIAAAKVNTDFPVIEGIIVDVQEAMTKKKAPYLKVFVTDGLQKALIFVWSNEMSRPGFDFDAIKEGVGVSIPVTYDEARGTFSLTRGEKILKLASRDPVGV